VTTHEVPKTLMVDGFRTRQSFGFGGLSKTGTMIAAGLLVGEGIIGSQMPVLLFILVPLTCAGIGLAAARRHGMPAPAYYWARLSWKKATRADATSYRRILLPHPYALDLPGVGASSTLIKAYDPTTGRHVGVVHDRTSGRMTVTTLLAPGGSLMAPTGTVQSSLRTWSSVLDAMSTDDQVKGASVTIQITPGAGEALGDDVRARKDPGAPRLATQIIDELVRTTPHATASVAPWMSVTVDPTASANAPTELADQVAEALRVVDGLDLSGTGTDIERRATDVDLRRLVRSAYDPDVFNARDKDFEELSWSECGRRRLGGVRPRRRGVRLLGAARDAPAPHRLQRAAAAAGTRPVPAAHHPRLPRPGPLRGGGGAGAGDQPRLQPGAGHCRGQGPGQVVAEGGCPAR
jgi:hypothetical protein